MGSARAAAPVHTGTAAFGHSGGYPHLAAELIDSKVCRICEAWAAHHPAITITALEDRSPDEVRDTMAFLGRRSGCRCSRFWPSCPHRRDARPRLPFPSGCLVPRSSPRTVTARSRAGWSSDAAERTGPREVLQDKGKAAKDHARFVPKNAAILDDKLVVDPKTKGDPVRIRLSGQTDRQELPKRSRRSPTRRLRSSSTR